MRDLRTGDSLRHWPRLQTTARPWLVIVVLLLLIIALAGALIRPPLHLPTARALGNCTLDTIATVAQVERQLAQDPAGCSGRIVWVRGRAVRYLTWQAPDSLVMQSALIDVERPAAMLPLSITWGRSDPLLAVLRRLPLLGRLVPAPQQLHMGMPAIYRVQLYAPSGWAGGCAGAMLLDADPDVR